MPLDASVKGSAALEAWLGEAPAKLIEGIWTTTEEAVGIMLPAVQAETPIRTTRGSEPPGTLRSSFKTQVARLSTGARGRVFSDERYESFVERGTARHGPARHMVQKGMQQTMTDVQDLYEGMAVKLVETVK